MIRPTAQDLLDAARPAREAVEEFVAMLTYAPVGGSPVAALVEHKTPSQLGPMLANMLQIMHDKAGPADWVAFTSDTYVIIGDPSTFGMAGGLEGAFSSGDPRVFEQMSVVLVDREGGFDACTQRYRYTPVDGWEWDSPENHDDVYGKITDALKFYMLTSAG